MYDFTFYNPTRVTLGRGVSSKLGEELKSAGITRVLLLYGGKSARSCGALDQVETSLRENGIVFYGCGGVKPNPLISKAEEAIGIIRANNLQAVVAIGGGSVIDSGKAIAAGALYDGALWDFFARKAVVESALPLYAVVTVSATASEMNQTSVMTNEAICSKMGLHSEYFFPHTTYIDPSFQFYVPERQTVDGGVDAICHVLETYFDGAAGLDLPKEYAEGLVRSIMRLMPLLVENPQDYQARAQFAWASICSLNGTTWAGHPVRGDFSSHAIGHVLSARYDSVHGETLAVIMPAWMNYVLESDRGAFERFAERVLAIGPESEERASLGVKRLKEFFASLGAPVSLRELGVPEADLPVIAEQAAGKAAIGVLRKLSQEDVLAILRLAW